MAAQSSEPNGALVAVTRGSSLDPSTRRRIVRDMRSKGYKREAIAKHLGVSGKTVARDVKYLQQDPPSADELDSLCQTISSHLGEIEDKARSIFNDNNQSANAQIQALEVFRKAQGDRIRYAKESGYFGERTKEVQVTHTHNTLDWSPEMRERVARALIEATLTTELLEPMPEAEYIDVEPASDHSKSV